MMIITIVLTILLSMSHAWAVPFEMTASLDLSTFTMTGIPVTLTPIYQQQYALIQEIRWNTEGGFIEFFPGAMKSEQQAVIYGEPVNQTFSAALPGDGSAMAAAAPSSLSASLDLTGQSYAASFLDRNVQLEAQQTGDLTVSVGYHLAYSTPGAFPTSDGNLGTEVALGDHVAGSFNGLTPNAIDVRGVWSVTRHFVAGEISNLYLAVGTQASNARGPSVPVPDLFWPSLFTMFVLAWAIIRRRHGRRQ